MPPKAIAKNADRTGGVLPINAAARAGVNKQSAPRLKLEIRRLPPGLTLTEFEEVLGDDWKLGNGKVDWREYRQGKSKVVGYGKVPEQSRCYMHVVNESMVKEFEEKFLDAVFHDKAGTHKNSDLKQLPPTLGFAPNQRTPLQQAKPRTDNRQGTIDQDPEFIAFLEAETQPIAKPTAIDAPGADKETILVKSTPLIDDLREKKAQKAKAAQAKAEKGKEKKAQAAKGSTKDIAATAQKETGGKPQKTEGQPKETLKVLNKQAPGKQQQQQQAPATKQQQNSKSKKQAAVQSPKQSTPNPVQPSSTAPSGPAPPATPKGPQRQRGSTDGIKKMLQKDLGIKPKTANTGQPPQASQTTSTVAPKTAASGIAASGSSASAQKQQPQSAGKSKPVSNSSEKKVATTKAYLKHANPSQGMTEALIQSALSQYGKVTSVVIDPRKGTAVAVFENIEDLKKALEAKRVPVANGAIEILEFRERTGGGGGRGGFKSGRGGGKSGRDGGSNETTTTSTVAPSQPAVAAVSQPT